MVPEPLARLACTVWPPRSSASVGAPVTVTAWVKSTVTLTVSPMLSVSPTRPNGVPKATALMVGAAVSSVQAWV